MAELLRGTRRILKNSGSGSVTYSDGEMRVTGYTYLRSYYDDDTIYTPVRRDGMTYYYDIIYSNDSGNQFYIGIEKFDAVKSPTSNDSTNYLVNTKDKMDHKRVFGTMTLTNTASGTPVHYITVRVLNNWGWFSDWCDMWKRWYHTFYVIQGNSNRHIKDDIDRKERCCTGRQFQDDGQRFINNEKRRGTHIQKRIYGCDRFLRDIKYKQKTGYLLVYGTVKRFNS